MRTVAKFLLLVAALNLARYLLGWLPEGRWVIPGMFSVMERFPESFNANFSQKDFAVSLFYNFMLDAIILFPIVALANGLLYPRLFKAEIGH
ncbi:MAG: hypothetical protein ACREOO_00040 [bacterium]